MDLSGNQERPRPININVSCEEYLAQDKQLPQGFDMIFMNQTNDQQNEKLLIDAASVTSMSDLRSPFDLKQLDEKSPILF